MLIQLDTNQSNTIQELHSGNTTDSQLTILQDIAYSYAITQATMEKYPILNYISTKTNTLPDLHYSPYKENQRLLSRASLRKESKLLFLWVSNAKSYISHTLISIELPMDTSHLDYISQTPHLKELQIGHHQVGTPPQYSGNLL